MATSQNTIDFILDQPSALPNVRARKMFGEYALYCDEKVVALVCDGPAVASELNGRPRESFGRTNPCEVLGRAVASTAWQSRSWPVA